jgi:phosphoribosylamine---glycine ligase
VKVLVVGNGGREHALAWKLLQSETVSQVVCVPGNGGTATLEGCQNFPLAVDDFEGIAHFAQTHDISLVVVGPEVPLALGLVDYLQLKQISVFGPTKAGAQIEASKSWAKTLMQEAGIPTAEAKTFTDAEAAKAYLQAQGTPIVIKADGLAAGKGVTVAMNLEEAVAAVEDAFEGKFGAAGQQVVIEACLRGQEVSVLAITDGRTIRPLLPAQDHKRIGEGDTGENTGGMGVYAPVPWVTSALMARIQQEILEPAVEALQQRQIDYRGVLYAGLMITPEGDPKVIEFNCRFGDPETQVILPLLETPLEQLMLACLEQRLADFPTLTWKRGAAACVVVAAAGYPGSYAKGDAIAGLNQVNGPNVAVFHAGTRLQEEQLVTDGGRVLAVTGWGEDFDQAFASAYQGVERIQFQGCYYRRDIGHRVRSAHC